MKKNKYCPGDSGKIASAIGHLRAARDHLKAANCPKAAQKVRLALKSAEGAERNSNVKFFRDGSGGE